MTEIFDAIVIGGGPAGLATSRELAKRGVHHVVLERGPEVGYSWANLYESLTLHTGKHMSALPGMPLPRSAPLFVPRSEFVAYLRQYAERFALPVRTGVLVSAVERLDEPLRAGDRREIGDGNAAPRWRVLGTDARGDFSADAHALIVATGIVANPREPRIAGREEFEGGGGRVMHSVRYREPSAFIGKRVLVVGVGNSGGEIASEIARAGERQGVVTHITIAVRTGANVVPREILGIPVQYLARLMRALPRAAREVVVRAIGRVIEKRRGPAVLPRPPYGPLDAIPLIGFHLVDAIRDGVVKVRGPLERLTPTGAHFADGKYPEEETFDVVILATGFTPALQSLGQLVRVDEKGFALRSDRVASSDHDGLYFVGHNYDSTGGLFNIRRDATDVARRAALAGRHARRASSGRSV